MMYALKRNVFSSAKMLRQIGRTAQAHAIGLFNEIDGVVTLAHTAHGWVTGRAAREMALASYNLPANPTIVEVGVYMGRSTVLLGATRRLRGSGMIHSIDPFDCSGDTFSAKHYRIDLAATGIQSVETVFRNNLSRLRLNDWVTIHKGTSRAMASTWTKPIDLLLLDGDQTPEGAREAYELWFPFLTAGGTIILSNTVSTRTGHDGNHRLARNEIVAPRFSHIRLVEQHLFAVKAAG